MLSEKFIESLLLKHYRPQRRSDIADPMLMSDSALGSYIEKQREDFRKEWFKYVEEYE